MYHVEYNRIRLVLYGFGVHIPLQSLVRIVAPSEEGNSRNLEEEWVESTIQSGSGPATTRVDFCTFHRQVG